MSILSRFRRPTEPAAPLTEVEKQAAPGQHFAPASAPDRANLTVRRAPSLPAFAITGLLIGLIVAFLVREPQLYFRRNLRRDGCYLRGSVHRRCHRSGPAPR